MVLVRSTWDYQQHQAEFVDSLKRIDASSAVLENPLALMLWNIDKRYLKMLESKGIAIVPTRWHDSYQPNMLEQAFNAFGSNEIVVKPTISANADDTYRIEKCQAADVDAQLADVFRQKGLMIQPFLSAILSPGEYSLFYFDGVYSHAILKTPKQDDFRVQEEHGGRLAAIQPTQAMHELAAQTLAALPTPALYARIDLIATDTGMAVMEVEVIEPSLYFNMDPDSPQRFVDIFCRKYR